MPIDPQSHERSVHDTWERLHDAAVVVPMPSVGSLRLTGPDRVDFLNGQVAHDVRRLAVGGSVRSLYLDVRGHALDEMQIQRRQDDLHVAVEDGAAAEVHARLLAHRVFDDVAIDDLGAVLRCLTVQGPKVAVVVEAALGAVAPSDPDRFVQASFRDHDLLIVSHRRSVPGGVDVFLLASELDAVQASLIEHGATLGDFATLEASRVEARLARARADAGSGVLPQESTLDAAISTRKGCYLGQETMARIEARARLRRGLAQLQFDRDPGTEAGRADIVCEGRTVGRLGSVVEHPRLGWIALAVVRTDLAPDAALEIGSARAAILRP